MLKMKARYAKAKTRKERSALIDEAVAMTHYSRKYVIRLLNGSRRHRKHRGRKPSYSRDAHQLLIRIWRAEGYMCPLYLKSIIESAIRDYEELGHDVPPALADELTRMSASTMYRILRPHHIRRAPNKRSGNKASLAAQIPAGPGALEETGEPGILQVDTVALCGGDMRESFFWILHVTDAATQWGALAPCWNRGAEATTNALAHLLEQLPFPPKVIHVDRNAPEPKAKGHGSEFLNHHSSPSSEPTTPTSGSPAPAPTAKTTTTASSKRTVPSSAPSSATFVFQITPNFPPSPSCVTSGASSTTTPFPAPANSPKSVAPTSKASPIAASLTRPDSLATP